MDCDEAFLRRLALKTHSFQYSPGDHIITRGDQGREMYFVRKGVCEVSCNNHSVIRTCNICATGWLQGLCTKRTTTPIIQYFVWCWMTVLLYIDRSTTWIINNSRVEDPLIQANPWTAVCTGVLTQNAVTLVFHSIVHNHKKKKKHYRILSQKFKKKKKKKKRHAILALFLQTLIWKIYI